MTKFIYIATHVQGKGVRHVTQFRGREELSSYCYEELIRYDDYPRRTDTIDRLCERLYDRGIGFGARNHYRVSRKAAMELIQGGAEDNTWLFLLD